MIEILSQPLPWYVSGFLISLSMLALLFAGGEFGVSSNLRTLCSIGGGGKIADFFKFNWKTQIWNLVFILGAMLGGFLTNQFFQSPDPVALSATTMEALNQYQVAPKGNELIPTQIFNFNLLFSPKGFLMMILGGFLVGFGSRYAGGCTSGHAISGLSNLQLPSLVAVMGFFIGGLIMTWLILPHILSL